MATGSETFFLSICLNAITASERNCQTTVQECDRSTSGRRSSLKTPLLKWVNTVLRAVSGNSRDGACVTVDKQWYTEDDFSKSTH